MPLGPRGVAGRHGAVPVRAITVPGAGKRVSVLRAGVARSRSAGHERRGGRCGRRADRCGGRRCRGHRARGRAMTHTGRALVGGRRALAGGGPMAGAWPPIAPRPPGRCPAPRGGMASGEGDHKRRAVARCPASAVSGCAPGGPAPLVTVLGRCVECGRCRSAVSRGWRSQRSAGDRERDEPEEHDGGNPGETETEGGGAQEPGERPRGRRCACRAPGCAGQRRIRGRGLRIGGDRRGLIGARRSRLGPRLRARGGGFAGRSLPHDPAHDRTAPRHRARLQDA